MRFGSIHTGTIHVFEGRSCIFFALRRLLSHRRSTLSSSAFFFDAPRCLLLLSSPLLRRYTLSSSAFSSTLHAVSLRATAVLTISSLLLPLSFSLVVSLLGPGPDHPSAWVGLCVGRVAMGRGVPGFFSPFFPLGSLGFGGVYVTCPSVGLSW